MQWPDPPAGAGSSLSLTRAAREHPGPNSAGSRSAQLRATGLPPEPGRPTLSCARSGGAATGARPPCSLPACPAVTCNGGRRGRKETGWETPESGRRSCGLTLTAPSQFRARSRRNRRGPLPRPSAPLPPVHRSAFPRHFLVPPSRRPPGPARSRPWLLGQPERRPPKRTGVRRAAPSGLSPRPPWSS